MDAGGWELFYPRAALTVKPGALGVSLGRRRLGQARLQRDYVRRQPNQPCRESGQYVAQVMRAEVESTEPDGEHEHAGANPHDHIDAAAPSGVSDYICHHPVSDQRSHRMTA